MRAEIRARGEPVTAAELEAYYAPPKAGEDATDLWVAALAEVERTVPLPRSGKYRDVPIVGITEVAGRDIPLPGEPWSELTLAQEYLRDVATSMAALHTAANFGGHTRYPGSIIDIGATLERSQKIRNAIRTLQLEAYVRAHEGDSAGTANAFHTALMLGQSLRDEPTVHSMLVRVAIHGMPVLKLLPYVNFSDEELALLQHDFEGIEFKEQLEHAMCGDRAWYINAFDQIYAQRPSLAPQELAHWLVRPLDEADYIAMATDWIDLVRKPWPELLAGREATAAKWDTPQSFFHKFFNILPLGGPFVIEPAARGEALNRFAILTIALERMRRKTGSLPEHLQDLVPNYLAAIPDDPFTNAPFCFERRGEAYVVYSQSRRDGTQLTAHTISTGTVWTLPPAIHPYLLFRWPPLADETPDETTDVNQERDRQR